MNYMYWNEIDQVSNSVFFKILDICGDISQIEKERLFEKYVSKYFRIWDDMACAINGDYEYPPIVFAWWAEQNGIEPTFPIRICRAAIQFFKTDG